MESAPKLFNPETSPLREAYELLGATTPLELHRLYSEQDQILMKSGKWDYENPDLVVNRVKEILESVKPGELTEDEMEWRNEILWFWYHHAISCAIGRYKDKEAAKKYSAHALAIQSENHPNKITKLLDLLVNDKLEEAEAWAKAIQEEPEKETAQFLLEEYRSGNFFLN
ncbi:MAG: hypothetical protein AB201_02190 [Parcubacteria bacterium C7867-006]|nr:MAG: hypothetical protein AB201_02190 [Parcubacteria bacterium C7867-006]